jgi:hypothetical protein
MRRGPGTFRARAGKRVLEAMNAIRKVVISTSAGSDWGILGYEFENPDDGSTTCEGEGDDPIPVFQGIGITARPVGTSAEGVMLHVGNQADHPILVAVRDEDARRAYVDAFGEVAAGELDIFNGLGTIRFLMKADGTAVVNAPGGTPVALAKLAELSLLQSTIGGIVPVPNDGGKAIIDAVFLLTSPTGTTKLKGE